MNTTAKIIAAMLKAYYEHYEGKRELFKKRMLSHEEQFGFELGLVISR